MNNDFVIPVEPAIGEFKEHLKCHPRTILSARYGDGKSYFLNAFSQDAEVRKEFQFLTIYPVNYQVLDNKDIFDVIKYDILLQMGLNGMMDEKYELSSRDAFLFCMRSNGLDLLESLLALAGSIEGITPVGAVAAVGKHAINLIRQIKSAVQDYKKYKEGDKAILDQYIGQTDKISIYEEDPVTQIIQSNLALWRKRRGNKQKRIVLLFEDLDRIDPAHLFRILNIFSAHMEFSYKYGVRPGESLAGNKFGVDNVVMVIHYENLESIFHHFYGENTCFEGYIHKFADKGLFEYSLRAEAVKYFYRALSTALNMKEEGIRQVLPEEKARLRTLREMGNCLDKIEQQCVPVPDATANIPGLMAVLRRMGCKDHEIISHFKAAIFQSEDSWMIMLYPYLKQIGLLEGMSIQIQGKDGRPVGYIYDISSGNISLFTSNTTTRRTTHSVADVLGTIMGKLVRR